MKEILNILLEGTPQGIDLQEVSQAMLAVDGVEDVHDLHVWALTSGKNSLTAHVVHAEGVEAAALIRRLQEVLAVRFRVHHTTLQVERPACEHAADGCNFVDKPPHTHGALDVQGHRAGAPAHGDGQRAEFT